MAMTMLLLPLPLLVLLVRISFLCHNVGVSFMVVVEPPRRKRPAYTSTSFHRSPASPARSVSCYATKHKNKPTDQDWDADRYRSQCSFVYEYGQSVVDQVNLQPGESVLDIGCGTGILTARLASLSSSANHSDSLHAIGMDADPTMVEEARRLYPHITFIQADARNFTLPRMTEQQHHHQHRVDVIFSNAALHWIPCTDMDRAMSCMADALKPGGRFIVEMGGHGNVETIVSALRNVLQERHKVTFDCPWCFPTIAEFTNCMEKNGIETLSAVLFDRPTVLKGHGDVGMNEWLLLFAGQFVGPYLDEDTLTAINDRLRLDLYNGQQWVADYRRLRVTGRKR